MLCGGYYFIVTKREEEDRPGGGVPVADDCSSGSDLRISLGKVGSREMTSQVPVANDCSSGSVHTE